MKREQISNQIEAYLEDNEYHFARVEHEACTVFEYGFSMDEHRLGPIFCRVIISEDSASSVTELAPAVSKKRIGQVGELINRINSDAWETFMLDYDDGKISHRIEYSLEFDGNAEEGMLSRLTEWGPHIFSIYNSAFYAVMMGDYEPKFVMDCMGHNDVEFCPNGAMRWYYYPREMC